MQCMHSWCTRSETVAVGLFRWADSTKLDVQYLDLPRIVPIPQLVEYFLHLVLMNFSFAFRNVTFSRPSREDGISLALRQAKDRRDLHRRDEVG